jgi:hypothetical protein
MTFPSNLTEAVNYLSGLVTINEDHEDGRVNSIADEETVIQLLEQKYGDAVERPKAREFFDVKLFGHPIQIKSSSYSKGASDNFSSKAAILYALTTLSEAEIQKVRGWEPFESSLLQYATEENNRDYFIISVNKDDSTVHLSSLKSLNKLTPNGNNLPFQIQWKNNVETVERNYDEAYSFIIGAYKESVKRKISVHSLHDVL